MSISRWEATKQALHKQWIKIKKWTLENAKSKPARWTMSIISAASLASAVYGIIPTNGAWLAINIICTGTVFIITARVTSHGLSSQHEAPEKAKKLAKDVLSVIVKQNNDNIEITNENFKTIISHLAQINAHLRRQAENKSQQHDTALGIEIQPASPTNTNDAEDIRLLAETHGIKPLLAIHIDQTPDINEQEEKADNNAAPPQPSLFTQCWQSLKGRRQLGLFTATHNTELAQTHQKTKGTVFRYINPPSPENAPQTLSYQTFDDYQQHSPTP